MGMRFFYHVYSENLKHVWSQKSVTISEMIATQSSVATEMTIASVLPHNQVPTKGLSSQADAVYNQRLRDLETENAELKRLTAEMTINNCRLTKD